MVRHFCDKSEDSFLCVAESRGDYPDCDNCIMNEDKDQDSVNSEPKEDEDGK